MRLSDEIKENKSFVLTRFNGFGNKTQFKIKASHWAVGYTISYKKSKKEVKIFEIQKRIKEIKKLLNEIKMIKEIDDEN